ncbi:MAG: GldG family protein [Planctomycetes bacterium]|nr:GldG family protein [Planctomycetota bacterium]
MSAKTVFLDRMLTGALLAGIAVVSNAIVMRHVNASLDITQWQENTLSAGTINIIKKLPDRARVKAYFSKEFPPEGATYFERVREVLNQIERVSNGKVAIDWLDPNKSDVAIEARKSGIAPREFPIPRNDGYEQVSIYLGLDIRCADRSPKIIPFVALDNPEYDVARALSSLSGEKPVTIGFLTREPGAPPKMPGFDMPPSPDRIFERFREQLKLQFKVVDLETIKYGDPIPDDVSVLILGKPASLDERERFEIDQYIMNGGRALILDDEHDIDIQGQKPYKKIDTGLAPLLAKWGVGISDKFLVVDKFCEQVNVQMQTLNGLQQKRMGYPYLLSVSKQSDGLSKNNPITKQLEGLTLFFASPIELSSDKPASLQFETLLRSSELAYRTAEVENTRLDQELERRMMSKFDSQTPSRQTLGLAIVGKFPSAFAGKLPPALTESRPTHLQKPAVDDAHRIIVSESKETRVVIVSDADFATNAYIGQSAWIFLENAIEWLSLSQDLSSIRARNQVRKIRNFEQEALKATMGDKDKSLSITSSDDIQKKIEDFVDKNTKVTLDARDAADAKRTRIKLFNTLGPACALVILGFIRMFQRRQERRRLALAA